jgi:F-type H+-transporting ATPase subunit alpha
VAKIGDFEDALLSYMNSENADLMKKVNESGGYDKEIESGFKAALDKFKSTQTW